MPSDLIPLQETQAASFPHKGAGITVGILDTGVDPGADGILRHADGSFKLLNIHDCTGSGDVRLHKAKGTKKENGMYTVEGLSGRTLTVPVEEWKCCPFPQDAAAPASAQEESKEEEKKDEQDEPVLIRLGIKPIFELLPSKLVSRVKKERLEKFTEEVSGYATTVRNKLAQFKLDHPKPTPEQVKTRDDLQARLECLEKDWEDVGPVVDVVVYFDGEHKRVVLTNDGTLEGTKGMAAFPVEHEYRTLIGQMNYTAQFYGEDVVALCCDTSPHGTHVASIVAHATKGVAPQANLISYKIGDTRINGMETGTALTRALIMAANDGCDVINLSYGEGCVHPNHGRFVELARELVYKHNVMFLASAGNNGPALSTVGAPGGLSSSIMGVAAYVSPDMMQTSYSMITSNGEESSTDDASSLPVATTYTWSSTGPSADGDIGVNISAPGGAIASVSNWCLQKSRLMNGTSMSSPNAAGCVALVLSACKQEGIETSVTRVRRAIENTALTDKRLLELQQGYGMIQVERAFEYIKKFHKMDTEDIWFSVSVENRSGRPRGIYLRQADETTVSQTYSVSVEPHWGHPDDTSDEQQSKRMGFEQEYELEATVNWVKAASSFVLVSGGRSFKVTVDPVTLESGVHTAKVVAYERRDQERIPMFQFPVTVCKPLATQRVISLGKTSFSAAEVKRFFVVPPAGSTWMDVTVKDCRQEGTADKSTRLFILHTIQLLPHAAYRDYEKDKTLNLLPNQTVVASVAVEENITCEVDLARYWSTVGPCELEVSIEFRGITAVGECVLGAGGRGSLLRIRSDLKDEVIQPKVTLTKWLTPLSPKADPLISDVGPRDVMTQPERKIHQLMLEYEFEQEEKGSVTPKLFFLQEILYESSFESQLMIFYDGDKKIIGYSDAWPSSLTLPKGNIIVRLQVRHHNVSLLEKLKDSVLWLERSLSKSLSPSVYSSRELLMKEGPTFSKRMLRKGTCQAIFVAEPSKVPATCKAGDILEGKVELGGNDSALPGEGGRPGGFPVRYIVGPKAKKSSTDAEPPKPKDERTAKEKFDESVRDAKLDHLNKLSEDDKKAGAFDELYELLLAEYPTSLPLRMAKLKQFDTSKSRDVKSVVAAADEAIALVDQDALALHFGRKVNGEDGEALKLRDEMKERKTMLIEALFRKALAVSEDGSSEEFDTSLKQLKEWVDIDGNGKYGALVIEREKRARRLGNSLKTIEKLLSKEAKDDGIKSLSKATLYLKRSEIFAELGYTVLVSYDKAQRIVSSPREYAPF